MKNMDLLITDWPRRISQHECVDKNFLNNSYLNKKVIESQILSPTIHSKTLTCRSVHVLFSKPLCFVNELQ